jgi:tRNA1(Val) A37 N6-methylase TrmN6
VHLFAGIAESNINLNHWAEEIKLVNAEISFTIGSFEYGVQYWMARASGGFSPG